MSTTTQHGELGRTHDVYPSEKNDTIILHIIQPDARNDIRLELCQTQAALLMRSAGYAATVAEQNTWDAKDAEGRLAEYRLGDTVPDLNIQGMTAAEMAMARGEYRPNTNV